ncbi:hypothetical protein CN354_00955 [Bacillus cereus]|nr:hypothetical protein CN354_00955 [Bacillus cereus]WJE51803.1 hypothetical protein QRE66_21330 [Bacillus cereus]
MKTFLLDLSQIQPSQLFLNEAKIYKLQQSFSPQKILTNSPLPIKQLDDRIIFTDGHTRAYMHWLANIKQIPVYWDEDPLHYELYRLCVEWCTIQNIFHIGHLHKRILPAFQYKLEWIQKCIQAEKTIQNHTTF